MDKQKYIDGILYKLCACGVCGKYFIAHKTTGGKEARFIKGHQSIGKHHSEETKEKNRQAHLGKVPWNKGKTGIYSEETLLKIKKARKKQVIKSGWHHSEESKEKNRLAHLGKTQTEESNRKRSIAMKDKLKSGEHKKNISKARIGEKNPAWKGGITEVQYPQDWTEDLKDAIRKRDNYTCQICGITQDKLNGLYKKLDVHHIDYSKEKCDPENLISLCRSCHAKTSYNRNYWIIYFNPQQINCNNTSILLQQSI